MANTIDILEKSRARVRCRASLGLAIGCLLVLIIPACSTDRERRAVSRDPEGHRVFYEGWLHPTRS